MALGCHPLKSFTPQWFEWEHVRSCLAKGDTKAIIIVAPEELGSCCRVAAAVCWFKHTPLKDLGVTQFGDLYGPLCGADQSWHTALAEGHRPAAWPRGEWNSSVLMSRSASHSPTIPPRGSERQMTTSKISFLYATVPKFCCSPAESQSLTLKPFCVHTLGLAGNRSTASWDSIEGQRSGVGPCWRASPPPSCHRSASPQKNSQRLQIGKS